MTKNFTLQEIAHETMKEHGFIPDFSKQVLSELNDFHAPAKPDPSHRDLRDLLWISIDNDDSKDLDQLTYAEKGKLFVAIADVDALIKKGSAIDLQASHNTTSVYTPGFVFPMLPLKLSTNLTSLNENADRCAIVVEISVANDGKFDLIDLYPALVRNQAKLAYPSVGSWLEGKVAHSIPSLAHVKEQLKLQDQMCRKIQEYRDEKGALTFGPIQLTPVMQGDIPVDLEERELNRAHKLIENAMISANVAVTRYLVQHNMPTLRRVVKTPKKWDRIVAIAKDLGTKLPSQPDPKSLRQFLQKQQKEAPLQFPDLSLAMIKLLGKGEYVLGVPGKPSPGHFDLAEHEYSHTTAPNRRYPDLIMQRLLKNVPYSNQELATLAAHCTEKEDDAAKVERKLIKCAAAIVMEKRVGETFPAMVTGASPKGTWVRINNPPIEGKLTRGFKGLDVGDFIKVKLTKVDTLNGHIDFSKD